MVHSAGQLQLEHFLLSLMNHVSRWRILPVSRQLSAVLSVAQNCHSRFRVSLLGVLQVRSQDGQTNMSRFLNIEKIE